MARIVTGYPALSDFKIKNLEGKNGYSIHADGTFYLRWIITEDEIEVTTTVDTHSFLITKE